MRVLFLERGGIWRYGLPDGLRDLGHEVEMSGPVVQTSVIRQINAFKPDLLIYVGWGYDHTPAKQRLVRRLADDYNLPLVYWSTEDPNFTKAFTIPLLKRVNPDYVFTISPNTVSEFRQLGYPCEYMDFAFHPGIHHAVRPVPKYKADIAVVANAYPDVLKRYPRHYRRQAIDILIKPLLKAGYRIHFYGRNWHLMKPFLGRSLPASWIKKPIAYKDANKVYSSAKIMLGLQNYKNMATQRTYEIVGSGGFLLTCNTGGVRKLLQHGRDAALSSTPQETLKLVRHYLANAKEREQVRQSGRKAIDTHSYTERAKSMLETLKKHGVISDKDIGE
ncbi:CgeB family protein [Paenibacillus glycanilyticus]|uniref:Spore protein YkvP n=1 Tax=Paenibacillus glycanilyticus TaxID=126569 RepID=A0ABQ6GFN4_9BACL|nr:glycosyltransferase [Paenibacillus glycanilyticus]GLX68148.1 spore protein YkvP [Paenibacillus glycanilyticus]